jgi:hypothetical protein
VEGGDVVGAGDKVGDAVGDGVGEGVMLGVAVGGGEKVGIGEGVTLELPQAAATSARPTREAARRPRDARFMSAPNPAFREGIRPGERTPTFVSGRVRLPVVPCPVSIVIARETRLVP